MEKLTNISLLRSFLKLFYFLYQHFAASRLKETKISYFFKLCQSAIIP